jgi:hypothetical protein
MTDSTATPSDAPQQAQPQPWMIVRGLLRALASTAALVALYYLLPLGLHPLARRP